MIVSNASDVVERQVSAGHGSKPALIADDATLTYDELRRQVNRAGRLCRGRDDAGVIELDEALRGQSDELEAAPTHRDDMAFWLYSSGSTGKPKGVVHLHHDIEVTSENYARHVLALNPDDVTFST